MWAGAWLPFRFARFGLAWQPFVSAPLAVVAPQLGDVAQGNELLCQVLCQDLCCVIQSMYKLGIEPEFRAAE